MVVVGVVTKREVGESVSPATGCERAVILRHPGIMSLLELLVCWVGEVDVSENGSIRRPRRSGMAIGLEVVTCIASSCVGAMACSEVSRLRSLKGLCSSIDGGREGGREEWGGRGSEEQGRWEREREGGMWRGRLRGIRVAARPSTGASSDFLSTSENGTRKRERQFPPTSLPL